MEQFEAADKFLELFEKHPKDFSVKHEQGRDHNCFVIKNIFRAVEVVIDISGDNPSASEAGTGEIIRYIRKSTVEKFYELAKERLEEDRIQRQVDLDNKAITNLFGCYSIK